VKPRLPPAVFRLRLLVAALTSVAAAALLPAELWRRQLVAVAALEADQLQLAASTLLPLRLVAGATIAALLVLFWALGRDPAAAERAWSLFATAARRLGRQLAGDLRRLAGERPALLICAVGVAVRLAFLGTPMRHDEAKTFFSFVARPLVDGLSNYYVPNNHVLHTFFAHLSWRLFGDAPEALRLPAFLAGCALLPLTWLVGVRLFEKRSATWAAALVAACPPLVDYSTDARGYSLAAAAALAAFWILAGRDRQPLAWAAAALCGAFGLFAVPVMAIPLAALFLHRLLDDRGRNPLGIFGRAVATGAASLALAAFLYLPAILRSGLQSLIGNPYLEPRPLFDVVLRLPSWLLRQSFFLSGEAWPPMVLLLPLLLALALPAGPRFGRARRLVAAILAAAFGLILLQRVLPPERTWLSLVPLLLLAAARAGNELALLLAPAARRRRTAWLAAALAAALALTLVAANKTSANEECPEAESFAERILAGDPGEALVLTDTPAAGPLRFYLLRRGFPAQRFVWATDPPRPAPAGRTLFLVIRRGAFGAADLGLAGLEGAELLAEGPTSALWRRPPHDVSFAPP
jgi:hypothetical protein